MFRSRIPLFRRRSSLFHLWLDNAEPGRTASGRAPDAATPPHTLPSARVYGEDHAGTRGAARAEMNGARSARTIKSSSLAELKPLLIAAGVGAALVSSALVVSSRRRFGGPAFRDMKQAAAKTALVALARIVAGQTARSAAASALLDIAETMKS